MQLPEILIFDLGGVIINLKDEKQWFQEDFYPHLKQEKLDMLNESDFFNQYELGQVPSKHFISQLQSIAYKPISAEKIKVIWNKRLLNIPFERIKLIQRLKQKHQIYLLSNTNRIHIERVIEYSIATFGFNLFEELFIECFYSDFLKVAKPNTAIYEVVHKAIGNPSKKDCLFFDDNVDNIKSAISFGWNGLIIDKDITELI